MATIYIYALNTLADWEIAHLISEVNSRRFFKKDAKACEIRYVGADLEPITTMGGLSIVPTEKIDEIEPQKGDILVLPGADTWNDPKNAKAIEVAGMFLNQGICVAAICGATVALAAANLLNERPHTSNGAGFLEMMVPTYQGTAQFVDAPSVVDDNLITAAVTGYVSFTKNILEKMDVMSETALNNWFQFFHTGNGQYFFGLLQEVGM